MYTVQRTHHLSHLMNILPLITFLFIVQCIILYNISNGTSVIGLCYSIAIALIVMVTSIYYYDHAHQVHIYEDQITLKFRPFYSNKSIQFQQIDEIWVVDEESEFSTLQLTLKNKKKHTLFFIDEPLKVAKLIREQMVKPVAEEETQEPKAA
jgi:hypothetical protein